MVVNLLRKNLRIALYSKSWLILGSYWLLLLFFISKFSPPEVGGVAYVVAGFVIAMVLISVPDSQDVKYGMEPVFATVPVKRSHIVYADYLTSVIMTLVAIFYTWAAGLALLHLVPLSLLHHGRLMSMQEILYAFLITLLSISLNTPFKFEFGSFYGRPGPLYVSITITMLILFYVFPMILCIVFFGNVGRAYWDTYNILAPTVKAVEALSSPAKAIGLTLLMGLFTAGSAKLSVGLYNERDI